MQRIKKVEKSLSSQMKKRVSAKASPVEEYDGDFDHIIHTGSTLLDLNISGDRLSLIHI